MKTVSLNAKQAHRSGRSIDLPLLHSKSRRGGWSAPRPGRFNVVETDTLPIVRGAVSVLVENQCKRDHLRDESKKSLNK